MVEAGEVNYLVLHSASRDMVLELVELLAVVRRCLRILEEDPMEAHTWLECAKVEVLLAQHSCLAGGMVEDLKEQSIGRGLEEGQTARRRYLAVVGTADLSWPTGRLVACFEMGLVSSYLPVSSCGCRR